MSCFNRYERAMYCQGVQVEDGSGRWDDPIANLVNTAKGFVPNEMASKAPEAKIESMVKGYFSNVEDRAIIDAIKEAEKATSGEIRLHVEKQCKGDVLDRASEVFSLLAMHKTQLRNGVLIYLAVVDRKFAIIGDTGINQKVETHYWGGIKDHMSTKFKTDAIVLGLCETIKTIGQKLKDHFPLLTSDVIELEDETSNGDT